jgi:transcriptional regulator
MYIPQASQETRIPVLHELMANHPLATLVTLNGSGLFASHVPMVIEDDGSEFGILRCHISRANVQWREVNLAVDALAIFQGHQHYISPNWYPKKSADGKVVPTWNYAVVHASGPLKVMDDPSWLKAHVETLTDVHEAASAQPWKVSDAPDAYIQTMIKGIVGLELPIRKLEGKWKVSQNRDVKDREGVAKGLAELNTAESLAMKGLVEEAS